MLNNMLKNKWSERLSTKLKIVSLALGVCLGLSQVAQATDLLVTTDNDTATPMATNCNPSATGESCPTLRDALAFAADNAGDHVINFGIPGGAATIAIPEGPLNINVNGSVEINGDGQITIDAENNDRIFLVLDGDITLTGLHLRNGNSANAGACLSVDNNQTTQLILRQTSWLNCQTNLNGGAIAILAGATSLNQLLIEDSLFDGNGSDVSGGAIYMETGTANIIRSQFANNGAFNGGAIVTIMGTTLNINASTIGPNNSAFNTGNAMATLASTVNFENSTISGHSTGTASVDLDFGDSTTVSLNYVTMEPNTRSAFDNATDLETQNSILGSCVFDVAGPGVNLGNNLALDNSCVDGLVVADLLLGPLADNGGPTPTHLPLEGSPAIDAAADVGVTTDQRGLPRPSGPAPDIGSVEVQQGSGSGGDSGGGCSLALAGSASSGIAWMGLALLSLLGFRRVRK